MIKAAAASKADAVKFQLVIADELSTPDYEHYECSQLWKWIRLSGRT